MIRNLIPWTQLTRLSIPDMQVARRPLTIGEVTLQVGDHLTPSLFSPSVRRARLRQYYEQRLLEPSIAPKGSRQAHRPTSGPSPSSAPLASAPMVSAPSATRGVVITSVDIPVSSPTPSRPPVPPMGRKGVR
jgi:hypothetical protein